MICLLFIPTFLELTWAEQLLWVFAVVSTMLWVIIMAMGLFSGDTDYRDHRLRKIDARSVMTFFTVLGWSGLLAHIWIVNIATALFYALPVALLAALLPHLILRLRKPAKVGKHANFDYRAAISSTGEVLQYIPPHAAGYGKVHLNLRVAPNELNAISAGMELRAGDSVRVIDITEDNMLIVEPLHLAGPQALD
jgi:hypothetical protein